MKPKILATALILLSLTWLCAEDSMFGAFRITTKPKGADVTLYDPDIYLCETPSPVYPVMMDEYMELREGIPGRSIMLMITKRGYEPLKKEIFVPFTSEDMQEALDNPSEFSFELKKDHYRRYWHICLFYSYRHRHPRPHCRPNWSPWIPPGHHHGGHGHHSGDGFPPPPPPPPHGGGGDHHDGDCPPIPNGGNGSPFVPPHYGLSTAPTPIPGSSTSKPDVPLISPQGQKSKPPTKSVVIKPQKQDKTDQPQIKPQKPDKSEEDLKLSSQPDKKDKESIKKKKS